MIAAILILVVCIAWLLVEYVKLHKKYMVELTVSARLAERVAAKEDVLALVEGDWQHRLTAAERERDAALRDLRELEEETPKRLEAETFEDPPSVSAADRKVAAIRRSEREVDDVAVNLRERHAQPVTQLGDPDDDEESGV